MASGIKGMQELLKFEKTLSSVFACSDINPVGVIQVIRSSGKKIAQDISVVGFDNIPLINALFPSLTTVAQSLDGISKQVVELLLNRIGNSGVIDTNEAMERYQRIIIKPELVVRSSTISIGTVE